MRKSIPFAFFFVLILSFGCRGTLADPCNGETFSVRFQDDIEKVSNAASVYGNDPTPANCEKFKDAYSDYIDALDTWDSCATAAGQRAEWEQALDDARDSLNDIQC